jgi:hypothetical protein
MTEPRMPLPSGDAAPNRRRLGTLSPVYGGASESGIASGQQRPDGAGKENNR